jgi:hypothetical protein
MKFGVDFTHPKLGSDDDIAFTWLHEMMHAFLGAEDYFVYDGESHYTYLDDYTDPSKGYDGGAQLAHKDTFNHADTMAAFLREVAGQYVAPASD